jgi:RNA polymerase sigma-70 factor (ECF subfamily)
MNNGIGLKKAVNGLNPIEKELIELAYYEGRKQKEISKTLNIPIDSVKTEIRLALLKLRA